MVGLGLIYITGSGEKVHLENERYSVDINIDTSYTVNSTDNQYYDIILNPANIDRSNFSKTLTIKIFSSTKLISIALIGDYCSYDTDCALLKNNILTVLQNTSITQIDITSGLLLSHKKLDYFGCNFSIHEVSGGYILYGEIEITMLDFKFDKKWSFSGRDIFVSITGKNAFEICDNIVRLFDFDDNYYEVDFNGQQIN